MKSHVSTAYSHHMVETVFLILYLHGSTLGDDLRMTNAVTVQVIVFHTVSVDSCFLRRPSVFFKVFCDFQCFGWT